MFNPFHRPDAPKGEAKPAGPAGPEAETEALRHEVESLRAQLAIARAEAVIGHQPAAPVPVPLPTIPDTAFNGVADVPGAPTELLPRKSRNGRRPG